MTNPLTRYRFHLARPNGPDIVNPSKLSAERFSQVCGQCHSVNMLISDQDDLDWRNFGYKFPPGEDLSDHREIVDREHTPTQGALAITNAEPETPSFWGDGMVRVAGREYNGLLKSPC